MIRVCSVCRKVEKNGQWLEELVGREVVSHGYCPVCFEEFMEEVDRYMLHRRSRTVYTVLGAPMRVA
ncbi:MAG: hypothetical protein Kow0089_00150 [Desulfobulbaceae bacterium]